MRKIITLATDKFVLLNQGQGSRCKAAFLDFPAHLGERIPFKIYAYIHPLVIHFKNQPIALEEVDAEYRNIGSVDQKIIQRVLISKLYNDVQVDEDDSDSDSDSDGPVPSLSQFIFENIRNDKIRKERNKKIEKMDIVKKFEFDKDYKEYCKVTSVEEVLGKKGEESEEEWLLYIQSAKKNENEIIEKNAIFVPVKS